LHFAAENETKEVTLVVEVPDEAALILDELAEISSQ
jgi:hypothetical protein